MKRVSLPHEHGGYLTVGGGALVAAALAPDVRAPLLGAVTILASFFARGPLEAFAVRGKEATWDRLALLSFFGVAAAATCAATKLAGVRAAPTVGLAAAMLVGSVLARWQRDHRSAWFEMAGMAALGAGAGALLWAGGATLRTSLAVAIALGANAAIAVPIVRSELRRRERAQRNTADVHAALLLALACGLLYVATAPSAMLALGPRMAQLAVRRFLPSDEPARPAAVGLRETGILLVTAIGLIAGLR